MSGAIPSAYRSSLVSRALTECVDSDRDLLASGFLDYQHGYPTACFLRTPVPLPPTPRVSMSPARMDTSGLFYSLGNGYRDQQDGIYHGFGPGVGPWREEQAHPYQEHQISLPQQPYARHPHSFDADAPRSSLAGEGPMRYGQNESRVRKRRLPTMAQRRAANIRERRRMFNLNEAFDCLRRRVPTFAYERRLSRIETLRLAMSYIAFMMDILSGKDPSTVRVSCRARPGPRPRTLAASPLPRDSGEGLISSSQSPSMLNGESESMNSETYEENGTEDGSNDAL